MKVPRKTLCQIDCVKDLGRSSSMDNTFGYKNAFKVETSLSKGCPHRTTGRMLERSQSLLSYLNSIACLQVWYSIHRGPHTPLLKSSRRRRCRTENRNRQLSALNVHIEMGAKMSETLDTVEEFSTCLEGRTTTEQRNSFAMWCHRATTSPKTNECDAGCAGRKLIPLGRFTS